MHRLSLLLPLLLAIGLAPQSPTIDPRVVPAYRGLEKFGWGRLSSPRTDPAEAYRRFVIEPYAATCSTATGPFQILGADVSPFLAITVAQQIEQGGALAHASAGLARAQAALPSPGTLHLCLFAAALDGAMFHLGGVGGVALGNGRINLFAYPTVNGFERLRYTAAHEYHHEALRRASNGAWLGDPLGAMVSEGKADQFATALYPSLRPKHTLPLSDDELRRAWTAFQPMRRGDVGTFRRDFMIAAQSALPLWAGYRLGFEVASACPGFRAAVAPASWLLADPEACLRAFQLTRRGRQLR